MQNHEKISGFNSIPSLFQAQSGKAAAAFLREHPELIASSSEIVATCLSLPDIKTLSNFLKTPLPDPVRQAFMEQSGQNGPLPAEMEKALQKHFRKALIQQASSLTEASLTRFTSELLRTPEILADDGLFEWLLDLLVANPQGVLAGWVSECLAAWPPEDFLQYYASRILAPRYCHRYAGNASLFQIYLGTMELQFPRLSSGKEGDERKKARAEETTLLWLEAWSRAHGQFPAPVSAPDTQPLSGQSLFFKNASLLGRRILFYYGKFFGIANMLITTFFAMANLFVHIPVIGQIPMFYPVAAGLSGIIAIASAVIFWKYEVPFLKKTLGLQTKKEAPPVFTDHRLQIKYTKVIQFHLEHMDARLKSSEPIASLSRLAGLFHQDVLKKNGPALLAQYHEEKARKEKYVRIIDRTSVVIGLIMSGATSFFGWTAMAPVITKAIACTVLGALLGPAVITGIALTLTALAVTTAMGIYLTKQINRLNPEEKAVNIAVRKVDTYKQIFSGTDLNALRQENEQLNLKNQKQFYRLMKQQNADKKPDIPERFADRVKMLKAFRKQAEVHGRTDTMKSALHPQDPAGPCSLSKTGPTEADDTFQTFLRKTLAPMAKGDPSSLAADFPPERIASLLQKTETIRRTAKAVGKHDEVMLQEAIAKLHLIALVHLKAYLEKHNENALKAQLDLPPAPKQQTFAQKYLRWLPRAVHIYLNIGGTANGLVTNFIGSENLIRKIAALTAPAVTQTSPFTIMSSLAASFFAWLNVRFYHQFELEFLKKSLGIESSNDIVRVYKATRTQIKLARLYNATLQTLPPQSLNDPALKDLSKLDHAFGENLRQQKTLFVGKAYNERKWERAFNRFATVIGAFNPAGGTFFTTTAMFVGSAALVGLLHAFVWVPVFISVSIAVMLYSSKRANTPTPEVQEFNKIGKKVELATLLRERNQARKSFKSENTLLGQVTQKDPGPPPETPPSSPNECQDEVKSIDRTPSASTLSSALFSACFSQTPSSPSCLSPAEEDHGLRQTGQSALCLAVVRP